jgi:RNA polymerase sigma factor (sigma-70 family)
MEDDRALLDAWRAGDRTAGDVLLGRYFDGLYRFFRNKVDHGVDDLIQRTFTACIAAKDAMRDHSSFRTYLFTVARHQLYHYWRDNHRKDALFAPEETSVVAMGVSVSSILATRQEQRLLLRALRTLPLDLQVALELHYWEELTTAEIAEILEVPQGTAKSRLRRAREQLEQAIRDSEQDAAIIESTLGDFEHWASSVRGVLRGTG